MKKIFDKIISSSLYKQIIFLLFILILLGITFYFIGNLSFLNIGFISGSIQENQDVSFINKIWYIVNRLLDPGQIEDSQDKLFAFIITISGWIVCSGILISVITNGFDERRRKIQEGLIRYPFKNHCIIFGYNQMTINLIRQINEWPEFSKNASVIIHSSVNSHDIRSVVNSQFSNDMENRIFIFTGDRSSREELNRLYLDKAKLVLVVGDEEERNCDSDNIECVKIISQILEEKKSNSHDKLLCYLSLQNQKLFTLSQNEDFFYHLQNLKLQIFNYYESWANKVLTGGKSTDGRLYPLLNYKAIKSGGKKYVRFVIIGFHQMGFAMAMQAVRIAHFNNKKTVISIIDKDISLKKQMIDAQMPGKECLFDIEFDFHNSHIELTEIRQKIAEWVNDEEQVVSIAVCLRDLDESISAGFNLPLDVFKREIPIFIRQELIHGYSGIFTNNKMADLVKYKNIYFFGSLENSCDDLDFKRDYYAKKVHLDYINSMQESGEFSHNDPNHRDWEHLPEQIKWSNRYAVDFYPVKWRILEDNSRLLQEKYNYDLAKYVRDFSSIFNSIKENNYDKSDEKVKGFLEDIELLARVEHYRWSAERILAGWKYGEKKDSVTKENPSLVPYDSLSEDIKKLDKNPLIVMMQIRKEKEELDEKNN